MKSNWVPVAVNVTKILVWTVNQVTIYSSIGTMLNVHYMKGYWVPAAVNITKMYVWTINQVSLSK